MTDIVQQQQPARGVDREWSAQVAEEVGAKASQCYHNAWQAVCHGHLGEGATYVEGWAVTPNGLLVEHGWAEVAGAIIDPTACIWAEEWTYFAGLRFTREEARQQVGEPGPTQNAGELPLAWRHGWGGRDSPAYMAAYEQARARIASDCT